MAFDAIVFDVDGTLWDSIPWYAAVLSDEVGVPASESTAALHGTTSIVTLIAHCGISRGRFMRAALARAAGLALYPAVAQTLDVLQTRRTPLGIFTSLPGSIVEPLLRACGIRTFFGAVVHAGNCRLRKPNGGGVQAALELLGVAPSRSVVYVGDRDIDARTAQHAGVSFVWAAYGYEQRRPAFVTVTLSRFDELLRL